MFDNIPILSLIVFSPLLGILVLLFMPKDKGNWIKGVGIITTLLPLLFAALLYADFNFNTSDAQYTEEAKWIHIPLNQEGQATYQLTSYFLEFKYKLAVDGLSLALVFLTALIATMAALASVHIKKRWKTFFILFLLLEIGMLGVFMARDLLLFFIFFELTLIPMFFLVGIWGYRNREKAAIQFLLYNGLGSALMLIAFIILVNTAGFTITQNETGIHAFFTGDYNQIAANLIDPISTMHAGEQLIEGVGNPFFMSDALAWGVFLMLLVAFGIKLPFLPFHTWMLKVHAEAPPSIVMIHSGILLKMGAYGLIRFGVTLFPEQAHSWAAVLAILGLVNILYGAILAFRQTEFKLVLAYSSISHMGVILFGIAAFNTVGLEGAIFQMVSHGLISALMFLLVGSIYERTGTTTLQELGGLAKSVPFMSGILLTAGMASLALPGLSGFVGEFLSFLGLFESKPIITVIGTAGIVLTAAYVLRAILRITYGPTSEAFQSIKDARFIEAVPMVVLVAFIVLLGVYPSVLSEPLKQTIDAVMLNLSLRIGG